jgi:hypothetical protein
VNFPWGEDPTKPTQWVVQADVQGGGQAQGSEGANFIRHGTVVEIAPDDDATAAYYGGWSNLAPMPATQTGDDADHSWLGN